jgi:hypothetical protein
LEALGFELIEKREPIVLDCEAYVYYTVENDCGTSTISFNVNTELPVKGLRGKRFKAVLTEVMDDE